MRSVARESRGSYALGGIPPENSLSLYRLSGKLAGASMRSKDLAKASGLAVAFDHTAPTFYRVSPSIGWSRTSRERLGQRCRVDGWVHRS